MHGRAIGMEGRQVDRRPSHEFLYTCSNASYCALLKEGDARMTYKRRNDKGVTVVEYAIMLALIAIAVAVAAPNITSAVIGVFSKASSVMN